MLVGALEIEIGKPVLRPVCTVAQHKGMGRARIEPDVKNIKHLHIVLGGDKASQETFFCALFVPCVCAFGFKGLGNAGVDISIAQQKVTICRQCAFFGETAQWHPPSPLSRQHPVWAGSNHRMQSVATGLWRPCDQLVDRVERAIADGFAVLILPVADLTVDRCEPLWGVAENHWRFGAPGMRIAMGHAPTGDEAASLDQFGDYGGIGFALFALAIEYF